ncbi:MAG TPA: hypothetical protein VI643_03195 [Planctomycetota bacterium]|nr:hypothetical protein [Planctomycetota bacterium]
MKKVALGLFSLVLAGGLIAQDKPPNFGKVLSNTSKLKSYSFKISGGADSFTGEYEKGGAHYRAGGAEAAGKGAVSIARSGGDWASITSLIQVGEGGESLKRLAKLQPPHTIAQLLSSYLAKLDGDGLAGFSGELRLDAIPQLAQAPWIADDEIRGAGGLQGTVAISCKDGRVSKIEIQLSGTIVDWKRRHYHGKPDPNQPPPTPPGQNWKLGGDGYWYEGDERSLSKTIKVEINDHDSASIAEDVRKKIGLK